MRTFSTMAPKPSLLQTCETASFGDELVPVSPECGAMIRLKGNRVTLDLVPDGYYPNVHPNCHAPAALHNVRVLAGGGSGTTVFGGEHSELHSIVMKHGSSKDTEEVMSLLIVSEELNHRGEINQEATAFLRERIPEFVMIYLSSYHVRNRGLELWTSVKKLCSGASLLKDCVKMFSDSGDCGSSETSSVNSASEPRTKNVNLNLESALESSRTHISMLPEDHSKSMHTTRRLLQVGKGEKFDFQIHKNEVNFYIPGLEHDGTIPGGVENLKRLSKILSREQKKNMWKVTLAQKTIGGPTSENGAFSMTSGKLKGSLRKKLIDEFTQVMKVLQKITFPKELKGLASVKAELVELKKSKDVSTVSNEVNAFVGSCIIKNFGRDGRIPQLRRLGERFRDRDATLHLEEPEKIPAALLGLILKRGASFGEVFAEAPCSICAIDVFEDNWLEIIELATSFETPSATNYVWTCGLTDAGLHNCFISEERGLELFDLGRPELMPLPAFLTKFLMSFFHVFGMEDDPLTNEQVWVNRFKYVDGKLQLRDETKAMIPYIYDAFTEATDHFIKHVFDGDASVRGLLIKYTVLQLVSDASFCLGNWQKKGGGSEIREREGIEKWLWRSLWDLYIASHLFDTLLFQKNGENLNSRWQQIREGGSAM
jgi:hypothetical protein